MATESSRNGCGAYRFAAIACSVIALQQNMYTASSAALTSRVDGVRRRRLPNILLSWSKNHFNHDAELSM